MMLSAHELARIFFAGESDEAHIVTADAFDKCEHLGAASIAIGVFDGVHRGHQELIAALVRDARAHGCKAVVVTFDPDPDVVVSPSPAQKLMTTADRLHAVAQTGVDAVVAVPFTPEVAALDHAGFLALLSRVVDIRSIRVGSDFRLGRGGASGVAEMRSWGSERGVDVYGHDLLCEGGEAICATRIRHELGQGHVELAAELLGRSYMLRGGDNVERRRLFAMEGAATPKLMAAGLELNRFLHDGNQVRRSAYLVFFLIANHGCSPPAHPSYDEYPRYYPRRSQSTHPASRTHARDAASA